MAAWALDTFIKLSDEKPALTNPHSVDTKEKGLVSLTLSERISLFSRISSS